MAEVSRELSRRYAFQTRLVELVVSDFDADAWSFTPREGGNHATWLITHMASSRRSVARSLGADLPKAAWEGLAGFKAELQPASAFPPAVEILEDFKSTGSTICQRLAEATPEVLDGSLDHPLPDGTTRVGDAAGFFYMHEAYHLGQIGYLRRLMGKVGMEDIVMKAMAGE